MDSIITDMTKKICDYAAEKDINVDKDRIHHEVIKAYAMFEDNRNDEYRDLGHNEEYRSFEEYVTKEDYDFIIECTA